MKTAALVLFFLSTITSFASDQIRPSKICYIYREPGTYYVYINTVTNAAGSKALATFSGNDAKCKSEAAAKELNSSGVCLYLSKLNQEQLAYYYEDSQACPKQ